MMVFLTYLILLSGLNPDTDLWLARSCVGEAGFGSAYTGECAAIAHVYRKRSAISGLPFYKTMRAYSAAIKETQGKTWVLGLNRSGQRPRRFDSDWNRYRNAWFDVLTVAQRFLNGDIPDPLPQALHFGGWVDRNRLDKKIWEPIDTPYRNSFYKKRVK